MFIFKTHADLAQLPPWHPALPIVTELLKRLSPDCGYLVLVEEGDDFINLPEIRSRLVDIAWDGAGKLGRYFHAVHLTNNEFAISFLIPVSVADPLRSVLKSLL
jgi:hypothetical protein